MAASPELLDLIDRLSEPGVYPHLVDAVEVHQTHISVVFLAGPFAYKIKKPVNLGFLDFSTLAKRLHFCEEEIRLNRRLAPQVYLGVIPVTLGSDGVRIDADGPAIEWAVKMKRLPVEATLAHRVAEVTFEQIQQLARRLAEFHYRAEGSTHISTFGRFEVVARNARENFAQAAAAVGVTVSREVFDRVRELTEVNLARHRELIESRAEQGVPRDTHGDLRLEHVYYLPEESPPNDMVIIDCIEFSDRFRFADPVADMAFLAMDLTFHGRRDLARTFAETYFQTRGDLSGKALLSFYAAYRAVVRAKVNFIESTEKEIDCRDQERARADSQGHWLLALGELEEPIRKPTVVMIGGLPGSGKSTLAKAIAASANFEMIRSDVIRKELTANEPGSNIYTPEWNEKTYRELLVRTEQLLGLGRRVLLDANFREDAWRLRVLDAARDWAVPAIFIHCHADPKILQQRLDARQGDASDADWGVYQRLETTWQASSTRVGAVTLEVDTGGQFAGSVQAVFAKLTAAGLC